MGTEDRDWFSSTYMMRLWKYPRGPPGPPIQTYSLSDVDAPLKGEIDQSGLEQSPGDLNWWHA
jgi:hypothetical protein